MDMAFSVLRRFLLLEKEGIVLRRSAGIGIGSFINSKYSCLGGGRTVTSSSGAPWLMLSPSSDDSRRGVVFKFHCLGRNCNKELIFGGCGELPLADADDLELAGSSHGWLAFYNWRNNDLFLLDPMSRRHIKLPPLHSLTDHPERGGVSRVALSRSPTDDSDSAMIMIIVGGATARKRLAFCTPKRSTEWTLIGDGDGDGDDPYSPSGESAKMLKQYEDVMYSSRYKTFLCVTTIGTEEAWKNVEVEVKRMKMKMDWRVRHNCPKHLLHLHLPLCWHLKYLVSAPEGGIFLVVRHVNPRMRRNGCVELKRTVFSKYRGCDYSHPYRTVGFDVYEVSCCYNRKQQLRHVDELGGAALFVGMNHSYAVMSAAELGLEPDCIYFADENRLVRLSLSDVHNAYGGHDNGIFNYKTKSFSSCTCAHADCPLNPLDYGHIKRIHPPPIWFTPPPISI